MTKIHKIMWLISLILVVLASFAFYVSQPTGDMPQAGQLSEPQYPLLNAAGERISLDKLLAEHETVIVHFWATWCAPCIKELPELDRYMASQQDTPGLAIIPIALDGEKRLDKVSAFIAENQYTHIVAYAANFSFYGRAFEIGQLPATIVFIHGKEIYRHVGITNWQSFVLPTN